MSVKIYDKVAVYTHGECISRVYSLDNGNRPDDDCSGKIYENNGFKLEVVDAAKNSARSGKLSTWECRLTSKDGDSFRTLINSNGLCDLMKETTFINGKCQSDVVLCSEKGQLSVLAVDSDKYAKCVKSSELKKSAKQRATTRYTEGDLVTMTDGTELVYLGEYYRYFDYSMYNHSIHIFDEPKKVHLYMPAMCFSDEGAVQTYKISTYSLKVRCSKIKGDVSSSTRFDYSESFDIWKNVYKDAFRIYGRIDTLLEYLMYGDQRIAYCKGMITSAIEDMQQDIEAKRYMALMDEFRWFWRVE